MDRPLTRSAIIRQAWPILLSQALIPLVGLIDSIVIGRTGDTVALAGVSLGINVTFFMLWSFGFLRMGTTGLTSQANGRGETEEVQMLLGRSVVLGVAIGLALFALQYPLSGLAFSLLAGGEGVTAEASGYLHARMWGAPFVLGYFAVIGWLFGLGRTKEALIIEIIANLGNIIFDVTLVWGFGMGATGIGFGTAGGDVLAGLSALYFAARIAGPGGRRLISDRWRQLLDLRGYRPFLSINANLMIRTVALLFLFTWLANAGARLGATTLAANHLLLQFVTVAAFFLDAFAFTAEERIGNALGRQDRTRLLRTIRLVAEISLLCSLGIALVYWLGGNSLLSLMSTDPDTVAMAERLIPFIVLIPVLGMPSWLLDGVFIGATRGKALRNAALFSTGVYLALDFALRPLENHGVWIAFTCSYLLRAGSLALHLPGLLRSISTTPDLAATAKAD